MDNPEQKAFATAIGNVLQAERLLADFRLEYAVVSGPRYGTAYEYEQRLQVGGSGAARLFRRRSPADTEVSPPGVYEGEIPKEELLEGLRTLAAAPLHAVPAQVPSPQDPVFQLTIVAARKLFVFRWSPPQPPVPPALEAVFDLLNGWMRGACPRPVWSLSLKALSIRFTGEGIEAAMRLENAGSERIFVPHPASPGPRELKSLAIRHGVYPPQTPGVTPLPMEVEEEILDFQALPGPELVAVSTESPLEFTLRAPVVFTGGGGRIGVFSYLCYLHPAGVAGLPVFAGAVFSPETVL
ncbi:MAG TPA: hypothetical protein VJ385_12605 [Fibrobacteria bacterium]|nr:hypothetical protein [Fibrobacteria bacterium]